MSKQVETLSAVAAVTAEQSAPVRVQPLSYSEAQSFKFWTAKDAETRTDALWSAIAPLMSAYLVNGGTAASLRTGASKTGRPSMLAQHIHDSTKGKRNGAARMAFAACLRDYKPRCAEFDQTAHDEAMEALELEFMAQLAPSDKTSAKKPAARFTVAQLVEALKSGQVSADDVAAIRAALPSAIAAPAAAPADAAVTV